MNVEIGTEAAQFPEKEYINGIFVAVQCPLIRKIIAGLLTRDDKVIKCYSFCSWAKTLFQDLTAVDDMEFHLGRRRCPATIENRRGEQFQCRRTSSGWKA